MKKLLFAAFLLVSAQSFAQTEKGKLIVGAGVMSATGNFPTGGGHGFNLSINPQAGIFVTNRWAVGTSLLLAYSGGSGGSQIGYGLAPFSRYYFTAKKTTLFVEGSAGLARYNVINGEGTGPKSITLFNMSAGPGITHFIVPNVSLEGALKAVRFDTDKGPATVQPSLNVGFQIYLSRKSKVEAKAAEEVEN